MPRRTRCPGIAAESCSAIAPSCVVLAALLAVGAGRDSTLLRSGHIRRCKLCSAQRGEWRLGGADACDAWAMHAPAAAPGGGTKQAYDALSKLLSQLLST